jgi:hypothetical protein
MVPWYLQGEGFRYRMEVGFCNQRQLYTSSTETLKFRGAYRMLDVHIKSDWFCKI